MDFSPYLAAPDRLALWAQFLQDHGCETVAEIGVYRGVFAARMLAEAPAISRYYMLDPWRAISGWNKPANTDDATFDGYYRDTLTATEFAADKRVILRGKTTEVIDSIPDSSLDFVYIDGDHTLKGISIDLIRALPKIRDGGWLAGDDFCESIWQHPGHFEPTLIFPFAVYFAEAHGLAVYGLPHNQFVMRKGAGPFGFHDLTGRYGDTNLLRHVAKPD